MPLWMSLLALASVSGQFATAPKPVISLQPPWTTAFQGESVLLTCNEFPINSPRETTWFYQNQGSQTSSTTPGNTRVVQETGKYRCQHNGSSLSGSVHLIFSSAPLILQAPLSVFEGDTMVLRCLRRPGSALKTTTIYKNWEAQVPLRDGSDFRVHGAMLRDNGQYHCKADNESCCSVVSNTVEIQVQELFPHPRLTASPSQPTEGSPVNLTCETRLPPQRSDVQLQFCFFREGQALGSGCSSSPELQIPAMRSEDTGFYWCQAQTVTLSVSKKSLRSYIRVRIPVSHPVLTLSPPGSRATEGDEMTLRCEAHRGSLPIQFRFFHEDALLKEIKATSWRKSSFRLPLTAEHSGSYYCTANNGLGPQHSAAVTLSVLVPVSRPVLTLSPPGSQATEGDMMTLRCEAQRGSLPIQFRFFHEYALFKEIKATSSRESSFRLPLTAEHSGSYYCTANNGLGPQHSAAVTLSVRVPVSHPVLALSPPGAQAPEGDEMTLRCEAQRGSLPIQFRFFHEDALLKEIKATSWRESSFRLPLTAEHSGNYYCTADNGLGPQRSAAVTLSVIVPVSRPVLTLRAPRAQALVGDTVELHCEAQTGSPPILYHFYHDDVTLGNSSAPSGGGVSFNLSLTAEHSGNYSCEADNGVGAQRSYRVILSVTVPASRPVLTLRATGAPALVGDTVELHCEAQTGSPPILYRFYHDGVTLGSSSAPSGGGVSFNLSLTAEHSGNYSCEADNGVGAQRSEVVTFNVTGTSMSKVTITAGVIGLLSVLGLAATATWVSRFRTQRNSGGLSATGTPSCGPTLGQGPSSSHTRGPSCSEPALMELQPVYGNVGPGHGDLIYSQVSSIQHSKGNPENSPRIHQEDKEPVVIYSELKKGRPDHCAGQASSGGRAREEASENYENMSCALSTMEH